ncbi:MAG: T9SS type A sorting domain-containing protein [Haliscomenobacter sp.]|uniref:T9SS type A sorting domain-containing protein n=1 Tax=Haliscomenobacter sp. TaxID=2717303 RepID=UPI0029A9EBD7|nr:T9SS type A sorting domain-containing protein [Haliscomenobacter sp.]MDX2070267.1 T9SS type A sorting domain-containing protein [Haliscomenobacter sp.]
MTTYSIIAKIGLIICLAIFLPNWICAQKWQNLQTFGGSGNENPGDLYCNNDGHCATGFTFQGKMELDGRTLNSQGGSDFVILQRPKGNAQYRYFSHGGGPLDEEIVAVRPLNNGGLLCAGVFWQELVLPDTTLTALDAGKAIFVLSYLPSGQLSWAKVIDGSGLKIISDVLLNNNGNIWLSGSFSDTLFVEGKKWTAAGQSDLFLMRLESDGRMQWLQHHGVMGSTRLAGIAELPGRAVAGIGSFDKSVQFGNDIFAANTSDQDLFITAWGPDGQVLWARKGGGVYEATPIDIVTDDKGGIYFCGNIVGVIRFDNGLSIQSKDGNSDLFLGAFSSSGTLQWARTFTGEQVQECSRMLWQNKQIYLSGYTLGRFNYGGKDINPSDGFSSFLAILDTLGRPTAVEVLDASGGLYSGGLAYSVGSQLQLAGVYRGTGNLETLPLPASSSFDFFTADFSTLVTGIPNVLVADPQFKVFPTPSKDMVYIQNTRQAEPYTVHIYDAFGRRIQEITGSPVALDTSRFSPGVYLLQIRQAAKWSLYKIIRQ